jgi:rhodanese-related sulfurtransferase
MTSVFPDPLRARAYFQLRMLPAIARSWRSRDQADEYFRAKRLLTVGPTEVYERMQDREDMVVVDVREATDYESGHIPGAVHFPRCLWDAHGPFRRGVFNVVYCDSFRSPLAAEAAAEFSGRGYAVIEMNGGFESWLSGGLPVEKACPRV